MVWPASNCGGELDAEMPRSVTAVTAITETEELLVGFWSLCCPLTWKMLVKNPPSVGCTVSVTRAPAPLVKLGHAQVMKPLLFVQPPEVVASEMKVSPAGMV